MNESKAVRIRIRCNNLTVVNSDRKKKKTRNESRLKITALWK